MASYHGQKRNELSESIVNDIELEKEDKNNAESIIRRLSEEVAKRGYEDVIQEVVSKSGQTRSSSIVGNTAPINLIPGKPGAPCCTIVVAMASGSRKGKRMGFPQTMRNLRSHLICCAQITKLAIVVTDVWDPKLLEESRQDLLAHKDNGLQLVVLFAADKTLMHLPINLKSK